MNPAAVRTTSQQRRKSFEGAAGQFRGEGLGFRVEGLGFRDSGFSRLLLAGNEEMGKKMETIILGYIGTTGIHSFIPS